MPQSEKKKENAKATANWEDLSAAEQTTRRAVQTACLHELHDVLKNATDAAQPPDRVLWDTLRAFEGCPFYTVRGIAFRYHIRGNELFVDRKEKSVTRATVTLAASRVLAMRAAGNAVTGPKKIGTFGASYLYPVFQAIGLLH